MNEYFSKTVLPKPIKIDWTTIWPDEKPDDPVDIPPRFRLINPSDPSVFFLWENKEFTYRLHNAGLAPHFIRIFRWSPNKVFPWHIDGSDTARFCALNWILDGAGEIQWNTKMEVFKDPATRTYRNNAGSPEDPFEVSSDGHGCLVNTLIPHRVSNLNNIHRVSMSMMFNLYFTYSEVYNRLLSVDLIQT